MFKIIIEKKISMNKPITYLSILCILLSLAYSCSKPEPTAMEQGEIDTSQDPIQTSTDQGDIIILEIEDGVFELKPMAQYKASVMVMSKESYSYGWMGKVVPIDLALAWGKLTEPQYDKHIDYSQSDRYYFFEYSSESPLNAGYIGKHSANNHIIPATENMLKALKSVKKKQKVVLEGFLVYLKGTYKGEKVFWNSSLTRDDHGDNSCELFFVEKVRIGDYVYE
jgi:hypothetical protein